MSSPLRFLEDDPDIPDDELLFRSIPINHINNSIISSATFKGSKKNPHISVDRSSLSTKEETLNRHPDHAGVAQLLTGKVREFTIGVASTPKSYNPAHAEIIRDFSMSNNQWSKVARSLAKACDWAIAPSL